jgi:hypothetical protein
MANQSSGADEFFIGWLPTPRTYFHFLRPLVIALLIGGAGLAVLLAVWQRSPGAGRWDDDVIRTFDGLAANHPYAMIRTRVDGASEPRTILLVDEGKFGASDRLAALLGEQPELPVRATGTVIQRDGRWLLELQEGPAGLRLLSKDETASFSTGDPHWPTPNRSTEEITVRGEIVDSKCHLGAMKPGNGKAHKACAMLCISGGIPPMLVSRDAAGVATYYLLTTEAGGRANDRVLPFVGDPVEVRGLQERVGDLVRLRVSSLVRIAR